MAIIDEDFNGYVVDATGNITHIVNPNKSYLPIGNAASAITRQTATPTNAQTVQITLTSVRHLLWLKPAADLAALTIALPADASVPIGQEILIGSSKAISNPTINGATTVFNVPGDFQPGDLYTMIKVDANNWSFPK